MKHFSLTFMFIVAFALYSNATTAKAAQSLKELTTKESTLNWMSLKKDKTVESFLNDAKVIFDLNEFSELKILKVETDELGWKHHRTQQYFNGIPIEGAEFIIHEKDGYVEKANGKLITNFQKERKQPSINKQASIDQLLNQIDAKTYIWDDTEFENSIKSQKQDLYASHYPNPELVYMSPNFDENFENYRLAYKMEVTTVDPFEGYIYYVDAHTGKLLHKITTVFHCNAGTAQSNYLGTVDVSTDFHNGQYRLHNYCLEENGEGITVSTQSNVSNFCCASDIYNVTNNWTTNKDAIDVLKGTEYFYDYMRTYHGQLSTDGNGELLKGNVNVKYPVTCNGDGCWGAFYWANQAWFSNGASFGGPLVSIDVVAHEFTHGLIFKTANLNYQNESGALNESFADIFGVVVERLMGPNPNGLDWLVGEDAFTLRDMSNPNNGYFPQPDTYGGDYWFDLTNCNPSPIFNDNCGVHTNSGVQNFWFYLLTSGGSGTNDIGQSYSVTGIGIVDAARIAYRNLTVYLGANSSYADAENGSIQAAIDIFGANSNQVNQVKNAWCAVGGGCGPGGAITLTSPNGNNVLFGNKVEPITWSIPNGPTPDTVILEFSLNNGGNWEQIAAVPNSGGYNWLVPSVQTDLATVRVTLNGDFSARDDSDDLFKILSCTINSDFEINTSFPQRCVNNTISFSNTTSDVNNPNLNGVSYKWFVNGVLESTGVNFQKVFATSGSRTITLEVEDAITCTSVMQRAIYVKQDLGANFTWDQEGNSNTMNFTANDADALTYNWTLNNTTISSSNTFSYNFSSGGTREICLSTNSTCGPSSYCDVVIFGGCTAVNANFTINDSDICANNTASFTSTSTGGGSTRWFVNGVDEGNGPIFFYEFPSEGVYTLALEAKNGSCIDIKSETIMVDPNAFELEGIDNYMNCASSNTSLDAGINDMQSYQWLLNNTVKGVNKTLTATESGFYTINVTDKCGQSSSKDVLVALNDQDCIRPGDMNADGEVNVDDLIYFGLHFGDCGFAREDQGIDWRNYSGLDWGSTLFNNENVDMKHADCNGNGCVDLADWDAFRVNWLKVHNENNYPSIAPSAAVTGLSLNLVPNEEETVQSFTGAVTLVMDLNVESNEGYDLPLYAGYVIYDLDDIEQQIGQINGQPNFSIEQNISWITDGSIDHVSHRYLDPVTNEFKIAFTRLDQQNRVSNGTIGQIGVEIINVVSPGINGPTEFVIEPSELAFFNAAGEQLPLGQSTSVMSSSLWNDQCRNNNVTIDNNNNSINYQSVYTSGTITTNGNVCIVNGSNITYGGERVRLNSGFKASADSNFKVRYGCTPLQNNGQKEDDENPNDNNDAPLKEDEKVIKSKAILSSE